VVAFGEEQQTPAGFEIEWFAARSQSADDDCACSGERLFGSPERVLTLLGADHDELIERETVLRETAGIRRAFFGERSLLPSPEHPGRSRPGGGQG
jgi:hypothetical protein